MSVPRLNWILFGLFCLASLVIFMAALASPVVRQAAPAPLRDWILPPPKPITISLLYSTEKEQWLAEAIQLFSDTNPRIGGRPVKIETKKMGSRDIYLAVLDGKEKPTLISPASTLQISILEDLSTGKFGRPLVKAKDIQVCRSVVTTPLVLVAWKERAQALWGANPPIDLWRQLHDALVNKEGWGKYGHPEWGYIKFGHTSPLSSNSGFMALLLMSSDYFGSTGSLTSADILSNTDFQNWLLDIEGTISKFGDSTGTYMNDIVAYGPSVYDIVAVYEATAIEQADNAVGRYGELRIYYPPATIMSDHPFCTLQADWVTPDQAEAARVFVDFLLSEKAQEIALLKYGFRPTLTGIPLDQPGSPLSRYATNGLRVDLPPSIELPPGDVLNTLLDFWARNVNR